MRTTRRDLFKLGALAAASVALPAIARAAPAPVARAALPLDLLILGGTGFTGPFQVRYALARGHRVTLFNRGRRPSPDWPGEVEQLHGDRETGDLAALRGRRWDACIDNPTTLPSWVRDAGGVLADSVGQYVFISSISVYADGSRPGITEDAALAPYAGRDAMAETRETLMADIENLYGPLKAQSESEARRRFGARATIIRPGYIVGPRDDSDRFTYWPHRIAQGGEVLVPGDGSDPVQLIDARDLAEWTIRLVEDGTTGTFNACGPDYAMSTDAMVHGCHAVTGGPASFVHVPAAFLERHGASLPIWVSREHPVYGGYGAVSNARAIAAGLGFRPLATTVSDLLAWFRSLPAERQAKLQAGISREREAELLAAWRAAQ
ncbi:MAG: NAD-dependent epimerase/dehydratase family protein [Burkholderiaceae bacterium]|nr:NAD-dependent epimerase/dehydratase family protein [Burkholderiaceae bacterium]